MAQPQTLSEQIELRKQKLLVLQQTRVTKGSQSTVVDQRIAKSKHDLLQTSTRLDKYLTWNSLFLMAGLAVLRRLQAKK